MKVSLCVLTSRFTLLLRRVMAHTPVVTGLVPLTLRSLAVPFLPLDADHGEGSRSRSMTNVAGTKRMNEAIDPPGSYAAAYEKRNWPLPTTQ